MKQYYFLLFLGLFQIHLSPQVLTGNVIAGGVTSNSARFRIAVSEAGNINVEASADPSFANSVNGVPAAVNSESDFAGIVNLAGLQPDTRYYYRILFNDELIDSAPRSFRTFPAEGSLSHFSFVFGSCQQSGIISPGNIYNEIIKHEPRFFLQVGDWGYPDTTDNIPSDNKFFAADYNNIKYSYSQKYRLSYPMDSLFRMTPVDYVYDDHDFMNNNASALSSSFSVPIKPNPLSDDFIVMELPNPAGARENSIRGYKENFPGYPLVNESRGIYHKFTFGNAEFFVLDLRSQRSPDLEVLVENTSTGQWEFNPPPGHSILGRDNAPGTGENQLDWFLSSLSSSTADWKFIVSSVPFNRGQSAAIELGIEIQDTVLLLPPGLYPAGIRGIFAPMEFSDKWVGFPEDLDTVLNFISGNNISNVIVLSGDSHTAAMDDGTNAGLPEIMAGGLDITNSRLAYLFSVLGMNIWNKGGQGVTTTGFNNAFGKVSVYGSDSVKLSLIDETGSEFASHVIINSAVSVDALNENDFRYELFQNYPNPFNPRTNFEFRISSAEGGFVTLKVYDMLGSEIALLVNEEKQPGKYNLQFDGSRLASGVYYYTLQVNRFRETKKFILLK